jgi:phosphotransferase system HPr-like phosphotransfer protein
VRLEATGLHVRPANAFGLHARPARFETVKQQASEQVA